MISELEIVDPEIAQAIRHEWEREAFSIDLLASANYPSRAVMEVQGSVLHVRSCEGYPGNRYHGGTTYLDVVENLARERAKRLFGAEHANVQPNSGVCANMAIYFATVKQGDTILSMSLAEGGHLSHGHRASFSGRLFNNCFYGVHGETELIDYDLVMALAEKERPRLIICGGSSYPRVIDFGAFREIADKVGAFLWADVAHYAGLIAGGEYLSPVPYCDFVTFTTYKTLRGCRGGVILCKKDYSKEIDRAVFPGIQGSPHMHLVAAKAVTFRLAMTARFQEYAKQVIVNARALATALQERGYRVVTGGTDTHIVLVDLQSRNLTGVQAQNILERVGIVVNKNAIPFDKLGAEITSGIRMGSGPMTARGALEPDMEEIADILDSILSNPDDSGSLDAAKYGMKKLCMRLPTYVDTWEIASADIAV